MKRNTVAMTLFETMIAICVATLLFISLASSFYMFRVLNTNTIKNSKKELTMMSIRDYIEENIDSIILDKIGGTCMYVDIDELADNYHLYLFNKNYYIVSSEDQAKFESEHGEQTYEVADLGNIGLTSNELENVDPEDPDAEIGYKPLLTIYGDYIIRFDIAEYYNDMHFYVVEYDDEGLEQYRPVRHFTDNARGYINTIGESIYYSKVDNRELLGGLLDGIFEFDPAKPVPGKTNSDGSQKTTKALYRYIDDKENPGEQKKTLIFDELAYEDLNISFEIKSDRSTVLDENGILIPNYGIEMGVAFIDVDEDGEPTGEPIRIYNPEHGISYVSSSDLESKTATIVAREILYDGADIMAEEDPYIIDEEFLPLVDEEEETHGLTRPGTQEEDGPINSEYTYAYKFVGWIIEGEEEREDLNDFELTVTLPEDNEEKKCIAVFEKRLSERLTEFDTTIDRELMYTYGTKETYVVTCKIEYSEMNDSGSFDDRNVNYVAGIYYAYFPEAYTENKAAAGG